MDQKEPTGTNNDGDLRGDEIVPCWFVSVGLLHRNFITGSGAPCGFLPGSLRAGRSSIYKIRVPANSDLEVKLRVHERWNRSRFFNTGSIPQRDTPVGLLTLSSYPSRLWPSPRDPETYWPSADAPRAAIHPVSNRLGSAPADRRDSRGLQRG